MDYNEYRENWELAKNGNLTNVPLNIDLELTSHCNLKCGFCPHSSGFSDKGNMHIDLARSIIKQAGMMKVPAMKFNLRGEPTLYSELPELIKLAKDEGILETIINTNGNCKKEILHKCIDSGIDLIIFSVDAYYEDTYKSIRGGNFYLLEENIISCKSRIYISKSKTKLRVQFVDTSTNKSEVSQFLNYYKDYLDIETRISKCTDRGGAKCDLTNFKTPYNRKFCGQPNQRLAVLYDGDVIGCCSDWNKSYVVGNANKESIFQIWHGEKINKLRNDLKKGNHNNYLHCSKCFCRESYGV